MKTKHKPKRVLLFVIGVPSPQDKALARRAGIQLRDPRAYRAGDFVEACDAVAGDAPPAYRERYDQLTQNDLAELLRPFTPQMSVDLTASEGQGSTGENATNPADTQALAPPPEPIAGASEAAEDGKATVDSLKAALDAKEIPYPKTAKKAELQALLANVA
ncbi:HeH/LEM domain-containing protein [Achromobacter sp. NPDC008082]|uniref:HeH/LEM domain-containing protein n=1 Tax=Achromobacter sp. NPDC008082 TaxID=3363888 RepID=UPI0036E105C5